MIYVHVEVEKNIRNVVEKNRIFGYIYYKKGITSSLLCVGCEQFIRKV